MNSEHLSSPAVWFEQFVHRYRDEKGKLPFALELKRAHCLRVAENARTIAGRLSQPKEKIFLAGQCGLLHDVGRFPQYARFGSFHDVDTIDHGRLGLATLEEEGFGKALSSEDRTAIACAVEFHNKKTADLPKDLPEASLFHLLVVRDADKIDILELVLASVARDGFRDLPDMLPSIGPDRRITPAVLDEVLTTQTVSVINLRTVDDYLVMLASWFYDLHFEPARELAAQRRLFDRIRRQLPSLPALGKLFNGMAGPRAAGRTSVP